MAVHQLFVIDKSNNMSFSKEERSLREIPANFEFNYHISSLGGSKKDLQEEVYIPFLRAFDVGNLNLDYNS